LVRESLEYGLCQTPVGWLGVVAGTEGVLRIVTALDEAELRCQLEQRLMAAAELQPGLCAETARQSMEYFHGKRRQFDLPLDFSPLTPFAAMVLRLLAATPYATTLSYGELAQLAGAPGAARAVGRVMAANPFPVIVPCHRVLGAGGKMTGYSAAAGVAGKEWLLRFEARQAAADRPSALLDGELAHATGACNDKNKKEE